MQEQLTVEGMKGQAKALRNYLIDQGLEFSHSQSLEAIAKSHDFRDWNTASALVKGMEEFWEKEYKQLEVLREKKQDDLDNFHKERVYRGIYATKELIIYCGWQMVGNSVIVAGRSSGMLSVIPTVSPYFEPRAVRLIGSQVDKPSVNRRFIVGSIEVGKSPQLALRNRHPITSIESGLISDVFSRSRDPLLINWSVFSTTGLARELEIHVYNPNEQGILVSSCIWGNAVSSVDHYA